MHALHDCRLKLIRAEAHLEELETQVDAFRRREPHAVIAQYDPHGPNGPEYKLVLRVFEEPDPRWGLIAGDFAHNVRSALDYLAQQLVFLNVKRPHRRTQFPIFTDCDSFFRAGKYMVARMNTTHIDMLYALQPFHATYPEKTPLALLSELSNSDKHRVLSVPLSQTHALGFDIIPVRGIRRVCWDQQSTDLGPAKDNSILARVPIEVEPGIEPKAKVDRMTRVEVALGPHGPIVSALRSIYNEAKRIIIDTFADEFGIEDRAVP